MPGTTVIKLAVAALLVGCQSVSQLTPPPAPTQTATPTATLALPTATPVPPSPTIDATATASTSPLPSASPTPSQSPAAQPSPDPAGLLFSDDEIDFTSGWMEVGAADSESSYREGSLFSTYQRKLGWSFLVRELESPHTVLRATADFTTNSVGYFGWLCGDSRTGEYYGAVPETDGSIVFVEGDRNGVFAIERYEDLGIEISDGVSVTFGIACALSADGVMTVMPLGEQGEPLAVYQEPEDESLGFDVLALYGEALSTQFTLEVSQTAAYGVGGRTGAMSLGARELLDQLPDSLASACLESPPAARGVGVEYALSCVLQHEGRGAEIAEFAGFGSALAMDSEYRSRVAAFGASPGAACADEPGETSWVGDGARHGRIQCAAQKVGARIDWTDESLNLLGTLVDLDGDSDRLHSQWADTWQAR